MNASVTKLAVFQCNNRALDIVSVDSRQFKMFTQRELLNWLGQLELTTWLLRIRIKLNSITSQRQPLLIVIYPVKLLDNSCTHQARLAMQFCSNLLLKHSLRISLKFFFSFFFCIGRAFFHDEIFFSRSFWITNKGRFLWCVALIFNWICQCIALKLYLTHTLTTN